MKGRIISFLAIHQPYPCDSLSLPSTLRGNRTAFSPCSSYYQTQCLTVNASLTSSPKRFRYLVPFRCIPEPSSHHFVMPYVSGIVDVLLLTCMYSDLTLGDGASSKSLISSLWHMRISGISLTTAARPPFHRPMSQTDPSTLFRMGCFSLETCMHFLMLMMCQSIRTYEQLPQKHPFRTSHHPIPLPPFTYYHIVQYGDKRVRSMPFLHQKWTLLNKQFSTLLL